jgi:hypothetical protein
LLVVSAACLTVWKCILKKKKIKFKPRETTSQYKSKTPCFHNNSSHYLPRHSQLTKCTAVKDSGCLQNTRIKRTKVDKRVYERLATVDTAVSVLAQQWVGGGTPIAHGHQLLLSKN